MKKIVVKKLILPVVFWALFALHSASAAQATQEILFFDDFSSNSLEKWQQLRGDMNHWSVADGVLQATIPLPFTITEIVPKDALWNNDWKNIEYSVEVTPIAGINKNVSFSIQDTDNWFEIHFFNNNFEATQYASGVLVWVQKGQVELRNGTTNTVVITQRNNVVSIAVNGSTVVNHLVTTGTLSGKIGLRAGTGTDHPASLRFDNVVVRSLDSGFPHFKQTDPAWSNSEYDSAKTWSSTQGTIGEYGCALASVAMILHAHGVTTLPSGELLTPYTLNSWLLSQPDGYIGEGLVNFAAVSRLSRILHELNGTTKLEYARHTTSALTVATETLTAGNPVMLQIPGHFLVGYQLSGADILIKDPAYTFTTLSQHSKPLLSARTFTPSNTDLSYIIITHDPAVTLTLSTTNTGQSQELLAQQEYLTSQETLQSGPVTAVIEQPKPSSGEYKIQLTGAPFAPYSFSLYSYTTTGEVTPIHVSGTLGLTPTKYSLTYAKDAESRITPAPTLESLTLELTALQEKNYFTKSYAYEALASHLLEAREWSTTSQQNLLQEKLSLLSWFSWGMTPETYNLLQERITAHIRPL